MNRAKTWMAPLAAGVAGGLVVACVMWLGGRSLSTPAPVESDASQAVTAPLSTAAPGRPAAAPGPSDEEAELTAAPDDRAASAAHDGWPLALQNELDFLREELELARRDRLELNEAMNALQRELDAGAGAATGVTGDSGTPGTDSTPGELAEDGPGRGMLPDTAARVASLVAAGLDEQSARELLGREDRAQLERLELIDLASREGWRGTERFGDELDALRDASPDLRDELGPDAYDRYLYELGQPNRVQIDSVISGSAAGLAGLAPGDLVLSYAGTRIFTGNELQRATRGGNRNEPVQVIFERDLAPLATEVPRGPLGVTLSARRVAP